ncbi:MAG: hypothetical protein HYY99_01810 [Candidatus Colwellbacteria bacterium]|nr:hypothetical protein [Candidatus Colwellbacteria bacterium]
MLKRNPKRDQAIALRLQGKSYGEILKALNLSSKGTLSYWFHDLELPPAAERLLKEKMKKALERNLLAFNIKRTKRIVAENKQIFREAATSVSRLSEKEILLIGTALYWGEGTLRERKRGYQVVSFSNSDPLMIKVFMSYLRRVLRVPDAKIHVRVQIHPNITIMRAINFWSKVTDLPKKRFGTTLAISRASKLRRPAAFLPYGTLNIRVHDRKLFYKIKGYIRGIVNQSM